MNLSKSKIKLLQLLHIVVFNFYIILFVAFIFLLLAMIATAARGETPTVTSDPPTPTVVCYYNPTLSQTLCPIFQTPHLLIPTSPSTHIANSPIDASRLLSSLPNYPLAAFHHWLFGFPLQSQAQRQYAGCIESINLLLSLIDPAHPSPIDIPSSPEYDTITTIRDYLVPFQAIQNLSNPTLPPTLKDAISHTEAAISSYNVTVDYLEACTIRKNSLISQFKSQLETRFASQIALVSTLQQQLQTLKYKCGKKCRQ